MILLQIYLIPILAVIVEQLLNIVFDCFSQYLASLQLDMAALDPCPERLPEILLEKCAAISVNPTAIDDLVNSMQCKSLSPLLDTCQLR